MRLVHGQPVVRAVSWVKADDVMMALDVLALLILAIAEVGAHTGNRKIFLTAVQRGNAVILSRHKPPVPPWQAAGRGCATRSASGRSD